MGPIALPVALCCLCAAAAAAPPDVARHNVVWTTPSRDASGAMPIGNGDIGASVYAIEDGDLFLLLAKNDAYTYMGDLFKTGRVRIALDPNPFVPGSEFRQTLDLPTASIRIDAGDVDIRIWADANRPVFHVQIDAPHQLQVSARPEFWERFDRCSFNVASYAKDILQPPGGTPTQDVCLEREQAILWYYAVGDRSIYDDDLAFYEIGHMATEFADPFRFNTFGNLLEATGLTLRDGALTGSGRSFDIRIHALTQQTSDAADWIAAITAQAAQALEIDEAWERHRAWWSDFWARSWIVAEDRTVAPEDRGLLQGEAAAGGVREERDAAALVSQACTVFRFLMACQSRGRVQAKFNGGLFTQQLRIPSSRARNRTAPYEQEDGSLLTHEDDRLWGRRFTYQNQRLLYWPLIASGDFDLMLPFFAYYSNVLPMRRAITRAWFGHGGAYYRENTEPTGAERDCGRDGKPPRTPPGTPYEGWYHDYYFTSGLETTAMMLDYVNHTGAAGFRDDILVPFAREVLRFYDEHYPRDANKRICLEPSQVLETWWVAVNPAPDIAGLQFCLDELLALRAGTDADRAAWRRLRAELPPIPLHEIDGRTAIAPAERWEKKKNAENGELYPVFPFRCFGLGSGTAEIVDWTMQHRTNKDAFGCACWTQDQIHWACAGNAAEAAAGLERRFRIASSMCRFPLFGRENPDSCPDFDHFGAGAVALQRMLVQETPDRILLLPAWPQNWDVDFRLHLSGGAVVSGVVRDGKLTEWDIQPSPRRGSVVVCATQPPKPPPPIVPANNHPVCLGHDQQGRNRLQGQLGRISLLRAVLTPERVKLLAALGRQEPVAGPDVIGCWLAPATGDTLPLDRKQLEGPVSFEAWLLPGTAERGRILDKVTPGKDDGLLIDTWPKLALRVIAGTRRAQSGEVLKPGVWQHVAVTLDGNGIKVYLNGQRLVN